MQFHIFILLQIKKFYIFQTQLYELSTLAEALPNNGCDMMDDSNDTVVTPSPEPKDSKVQYEVKFSFVIFIKLTRVRPENDYELLADCNEHIFTLSPYKSLYDLEGQDQLH